MVIYLISSHRGEIVATGWGIMQESMYRTILNMVTNYINPKAMIYLPLIYTIFHLI